MEMADALRHRGLRVVLLEAGSSVLQTVDPELGARVREELTRHEVDVRTSALVQSIVPDGRGLLVRGSGFEPTAADPALVVTGVRPNAALGAPAGVDEGVPGRVRVTCRMETNVPDVFAAGDCVETHHRMLSEPTYIPLGTTTRTSKGASPSENAVPEGMPSSTAALGRRSSRFFDLANGRTHRAARRRGGPRGIRPRDSRDRRLGSQELLSRGYLELRIHTTGDAWAAGRLLGAQLLGCYGAEALKRLDIFAMALFHDVRVDALAQVDLSYTPPLASPWDAVQVATMEWARSVPMLEKDSP